jgi:ABC-type uncharacterized transport system involved in gliding motility auxiliary subunit
MTEENKEKQDKKQAAQDEKEAAKEAEPVADDTKADGKEKKEAEKKAAEDAEDKTKVDAEDKAKVDAEDKAKEEGKDEGEDEQEEQGKAKDEGEDEQEEQGKAKDEGEDEQEEQEEQEQEDEEEETEEEEQSLEMEPVGGRPGKGPGGRRLRIGINSIVFAVLTIVGLILVNVVAARVYERVDLTEDELYTLSDASRKLVKKLPRKLTIKLFVSEKLVPGYNETSRYIKDLLEEYRAASNGKFKWEVIHPEISDKFKKAAERYGISSFVAKATSTDALEARKITFGMAIVYNKPEGGEEVEVLPRLFPGIERNIEYLITERIKRLTVKRRQILFISGHQEFPGQHQKKIEKFLQQLFNQYTVKVASIKGKKEIPKGTDVIVAVTPQTPYSTEELKKIDQFLMKGKRGALFMVDGLIRQKQRRMMPNQKVPPIFMAGRHGLDPLLETWGIQINNDVLMDQQLQLFPTKGGIIFHPAIPAIRLEGIRQPVTPFIASTLELKKAYLGKQSGKPFALLPILASTQRAWTQKPPFFFNVRKKPRPPEGEPLRAYIIGVLAEGRLPSFKSKASGTERAASKVRVAVIGDADMLWLSLRSQGNRMFAGNRIFLQNLMDRLAQDETLIKLRNKIAQNRDLDLPEDPDERLTLIRTIKAANLVGLPLLVLIIGIVLWAIRRSKRANPRI